MKYIRKGKRREREKVTDKWHWCVYLLGESETQNSPDPIIAPNNFQLFLSLFLFTFQIANDFIIPKGTKIQKKEVK